jgi:hypothetical protein
MLTVILPFGGKMPMLQVSNSNYGLRLVWPGLYF